MSDHQVRRSTVIDAPREEVWDALVDPSRLAEWLADEVEVDEPDSITFRWADGRQRRGVVEEVDAPARLALRWADRDGRQTKVVFELDEAAGGTRVTVTERGLRPPVAAWGSRLALLACAARAVAA